MLKNFKLFTFIAIGFFSICGVPGGKEKTDAETMKLHGKVKFIKISIHDTNGFSTGVMRGDENTYFESYSYNGYIRFNERGNKTEEIAGNSDTSFDWKLTYKYNKFGRKIEFGEFSLNSKQIYTYIYNKQGLKIKENFVSYDFGDTSYYKATFTYDSTGKLVREKSDEHDDEGDSEPITKYKYDKDGNLIEINYVNGHYFSSTTQYRYDKFGVTYVVLTEVDENNSRRKSIKRYKHDKLGNVSALIYSDSASETYNYDKFGNLLETKVCHGNDGCVTTETYQYEYDEHNNWTKLTNFKQRNKGDSLKLACIVIREIEYYK